MHIQRSVFLVSILCAISSMRSTAQQPAPPADPLVRENATQKVAAHTYVIPDFNTGLVPNVGIVTGSRAALVVDTGLGPRNGETVLREAQKVNKAPQLYLAFTHFHSEHDLGAQAFPATTKVIRSKDEDKDIAEFGLELANTFASRSPINAELLKGVNFRKTDISFDRDYTLDLGGVHVHMVAVGPTHTRGDTVFFVEEDGVLFSGDVAMKAFPAMASPYSSIRAWLTALDRLDAMKPKIVVPSHGPMGDVAFITRYREYFQVLQTRTRDLKAQGKSADEAAQTIQSEMQAKYPDMPQPARVSATVQIAYKEAPAGRP
jgi:glyoxylase-like metal-dependent hydrolase (beta-lactamase superfamily II)